MITCYIRYKIKPHQKVRFKSYARAWIKLVNAYGGQHHGYFLPYEGKNNEAIALFSFPSLAHYESYRKRSLDDSVCIDLYNMDKTQPFIKYYHRQFMEPMFE